MTTHPPFDPELGQVLEAMDGLMPPTLTPDLIGTMREGLSQAPVDDLSRQGRIELSDQVVPGPAGSPDVPVLVCRPKGLTRPAVGVLFVHGGGMIMGDRRTGLDAVLDWVEALQLVVVSAEYRLAPEHPYPAPVEDCYAALCWAAEHAADVGIDPARLLIAGESAGGGLAAGVALMARDQGGPALAGQVLMCPMLDDRNQTPSSHELNAEGIWDRGSNETGWRALLGEDCGGPSVSPYAAPARASDLSALPPTFIDVGSVETFRDEDVDYAVRIWRAGGSAELHVWAGGFHGFDLIAPTAAVSQEARAARLNWLRRTVCR